MSSYFTHTPLQIRLQPLLVTGKQLYGMWILGLKADQPFFEELDNQVCWYKLAELLNEKWNIHKIE